MLATVHGAQRTLARRKSEGNSELWGEGERSFEREGFHKALFVFLDFRREKFKMSATGECKYLQQTDGKSKGLERPERRVNTEGAGVRGGRR